MGLIYEGLLRPLMFRMPPEEAHSFAMRSLRLMQVLPGIRTMLRRVQQVSAPCRVFGVNFPNPVGLAAGFDKDAEALPAWEALGFGFVEAGTITAHAQPGNPKPRCFRYPSHKALVNRMGFNNDGADAVAARLDRLKTSGRWPGIPVGINIGKSKVTPVEEAPADYLRSFQALRPFADYFVINVSSPNTPGLRSLQSPDALHKIIEPLLKANDSKIPILVKIAPDLALHDIDAVVALAEDSGISGLIATNTTLDHSAIANLHDEQGGLSGLPLRANSLRIVRHIAAQTHLPVIASGGVMDVEAANEKFEAGALLVQLYTGFIYAGPGLVPAIARSRCHVPA